MNTYFQVPIGVLTTSSGEPVEIRDSTTINSDIFSNNYHMEHATHFDSERIAERVVHAKGVGAFGYFEVTHDVSKYTSADVFNQIGKKTPVATRFSISIQNSGGTDLGHDNRGIAVKFYTKEGNLDLLTLHVPVYLYRDPLDFVSFVHAFRRNPRTHLFDFTQNWDFLTLRPASLNAFLWLQSDYGSPEGYRKMDAFPIQTYELNNKHGKKFYARFNFRTEQGLANLTRLQNMAISPLDSDYFNRDLYNAIAEKNYPVWRLEIDVLSEEDVKRAKFNPFDVTVFWRPGTYKRVTIGRLVLDQLVDNDFADVEQAVYNPANLVPGIPGPVDFMFKCRRFAYKDTQNYRIGVNHNKVAVNAPQYAKVYNRDSVPPVSHNMKDVPNYYPNSYNGPIPYVDESRPDRALLVLENNAVDFAEPAYFYNHIIKDDAHRQRLAENLAATLQPVIPNVARRALKLLNLIDKDLGKRTAHALRELQFNAMKVSNEERWGQNARCFERNPLKILRRH